jgi:hypothetical protein
MRVAAVFTVKLHRRPRVAGSTHRLALCSTLINLPHTLAAHWICLTN